MARFSGWSPAALDLFRRLEADNTRACFHANKAVYEDEVRAPFEALSERVADELGPLRIARPNRDTRFSRDKSPYKTRANATAEGEGGEAWYVEISAAGLIAGAGFWLMARDQIARYRAAVADDDTGPELEAIVAGLRRRRIRIEGHAMKTAPRGTPRDHPRIELLRHSSLAAVRSWEPAPWLATPAAARRITDLWRAAAPLTDWLVQHVGPSTLPPAHLR